MSHSAVCVNPRLAPACPDHDPGYTSCSFVSASSVQPPGDRALSRCRIAENPSPQVNPLAYLPFSIPVTQYELWVMWVYHREIDVVAMINTVGCFIMYKQEESLTNSIERWHHCSHHGCPRQLVISTVRLLLVTPVCRYQESRYLHIYTQNRVCRY